MMTERAGSPAPAEQGSSGSTAVAGPGAEAGPSPEDFLPLRPVELYVLLALAEEDRHGYAIMTATADRTDGRVQLDPGTLYRALRRMERGGLVAPTERRPAPESDDRRRNYYAITGLGRRVAAAETRRMARLVEEARGARIVEDPWRA